LPQPTAAVIAEMVADFKELHWTGKASLVLISPFQRLVEKLAGNVAGGGVDRRPVSNSWSITERGCSGPAARSEDHFLFLAAFFSPQSVILFGGCEAALISMIKAFLLTERIGVKDALSMDFAIRSRSRHLFETAPVVRTNAGKCLDMQIDRFSSILACWRIARRQIVTSSRPPRSATPKE
jgi:hypothetical protein